MSNFPSDKPVLITCGLPYANGKCHIGHLRTYVPADIFVRSLRKKGQEAAFVCGSDAQGTPIVVNAEEQKITPSELVNKYHQHFETIFKAMEVFQHLREINNELTTNSKRIHDDRSSFQFVSVRLVRCFYFTTFGILR